MKDPVFQVKLVGTWERANTPGYEIYGFRKQLDLQGPPRGILVSFTAKRNPPRGTPGGTRWGTFEALVDVPFSSRSRTRVTQAKALLEWLLRDLSCRAPKIWIERDRCFSQLVDRAERNW